MDRDKVMRAIERDKKYYQQGSDIVPTHPELTNEENEEMLRILMEEDKKLSSWPDV